MSAVPYRRFSALFVVLAAAPSLTSILCAEEAVLTGLVERVPLAKKQSLAAGAMRFRRMMPEETGIVAENRYADPQMWGNKYHEFEIGSMGTGVSIADYDGDGKPDLFLVSKTETCRLFRNLGNWKFEDVTEKAGVLDRGEAAKVWKQGSAFVDVNNDGLLDLYVCRMGAPNLLYINQGNGTFKEQAHAYGLDVSDGSVCASFADYDRDGWMDLYLQTNLLNNSEHPSGQRDYLFHNNGNGTFTEVSEKAGILPTETQGHTAIWWDYDNDGWPDIYVSNDFAVPDFLYRNQHDGTFSNVIRDVVPHMPYSSMGADLADVNNDGLVDFMATDMAASTATKDLRDMAETRNLTKDPREGSTEPPNYLWNSLYLNTGAGRCLEVARLAGLSATDWTWGVRFEDLDNDGWVDFLATNGMHREIHNTDLIQSMMKAESPEERVRLARSSPILEERNIVMRNRGDLQFEDVGAAWGLDFKGVSFSAAFGDFEGDGNLDVVVSNYQQGPAVFRNLSSEGHSLEVALKGVRSNRFGEGSLVRVTTKNGQQVRALVVTRGYLSSSEPVAHFGLGDAEKVERLEIEWPSGVKQVLSDLSSDFRYTVTEAAASNAPVTTETVETGFKEVSAASGLTLVSKEEVIDEIAQQRLLPVRFNRRGPSLSVGSLVSANSEDVLVGGTTSTQRQVLSRGADGRYQRVAPSLSEIPTPVNDGPLLILDVNGDGKQDVLITRGGGALPSGSSEYQPVLAVNGGGGAFSVAPGGVLPEYLESVGAAVAADFNRDGRLDVFLGGRVSPGYYPEAPRSALWRNDGNRYVDVTDEVAPGLRQVGLVTSALWSDVDGDGWPDLLVALEWGGVSYFHNEQGKALVDESEKAGFANAGRGWWTSLASADFNGDGVPDFVVGNAGLNTPYQASKEQPALLFVGDFKKDGTSQLVEARWEQGKLHPWASRRALGSAIPQVLKKYPKNNPYAQATLEDILGAESLKAARRLEAEQLASGVFLSQKDGTYHFEPLPRLGQVAPLQGLVAGDFDGDGNADIYALENSYSPSPVVGRYDGGLSQFVKGDGHGGFRCEPLRESGLFVPGDAKSLAVFDLDQNGAPDFVGTVNAGPLFSYQNKRSGKMFLKVELRGASPNIKAIGARVQVESEDGKLQTLEVEAGGGWSSQSTTTCFFGNPPEHRLKWLRVLWPDGAVVQKAVPKDASLLVIER